MRIQIEAKHIHRLHHYRYGRSLRELSYEQELALSLSILALIPDLEDGNISFLPSWEEFDFIIDSSGTIEVYLGDVLVRRLCAMDSDKIECFFERCDWFSLNEPMLDDLRECGRYFTMHPPKDICVPVRML